ncbi:MAG: DUF302 domain-containing protein [Gammaproteobacteria bacterium]|nr:DUF302 domain-containing protein [Gammaproteobacteria bacterium]MBU1645441.1 DUF302 domain-containing protein [Gammaproteobacteria bacterium]MBU1971064.1 DUF302 domain-containing protein [Gammaproteobacteria bacterium]
MLKIVGGFVAGLAFTGVVAWNMAGSLMFHEHLSPFGVEETVARIQHNIQATGKGWALAGLRNPSAAVKADGGNTLPVMMVEACSTKYSGPILNEDSVKFLSILMPCKITVYKKNDGKVYIGAMNAGLMGRMFGPMVGDIMQQVAEDQAKFIIMDPSKPTPQIIYPKAAAGGGGGGGGSGC